MDKKLTLSIDERVIAKAKDYAKANNISLSRMIEDYLRALVEDRITTNEEETFTPLVNRLIGVVDLPKDREWKYEGYLRIKYK